MLTIDQGTATETLETEAGTALVPVTAPASRAQPVLRLVRPDPSFVTHLIATAERLPQTRPLRRAAPSDALSAYAAATQPAGRTGRLTRHVI